MTIARTAATAADRRRQQTDITRTDHITQRRMSPRHRQHRWQSRWWPVYLVLHKCHTQRRFVSAAVDHQQDAFLAVEIFTRHPGQGVRSVWGDLVPQVRCTKPWSGYLTAPGNWALTPPFATGFVTGYGGVPWPDQLYEKWPNSSWRKTPRPGHPYDKWRKPRWRKTNIIHDGRMCQREANCGRPWPGHH